jgi:RIO-like serine/threonine protein kinase
MSNTSSVAEDYAKIQKVSVMEADEFLFKNISQIIEYRKKVAIDIIKCQDEETAKNLRNVYERSEWHLKQLLGL